jgi:hypothetical protein
MTSNLDEEVKRLCREIPEERNSEKMMRLVARLNQLLDARESGRAPSVNPQVSIHAETKPQAGDDCGTSLNPERAPEQRKSA